MATLRVINSKYEPLTVAPTPSQPRVRLGIAQPSRLSIPGSQKTFGPSGAAGGRVPDPRGNALNALIASGIAQGSSFFRGLGNAARGSIDPRMLTPTSPSGAQHLISGPSPIDMGIEKAGNFIAKPFDLTADAIDRIAERGGAYRTRMGQRGKTVGNVLGAVEANVPFAADAAPALGRLAKTGVRAGARGMGAAANAGLPKAYRLGVEDRRVLSDYTDYLAGNGGYRPKPSEINQLDNRVRQIGAKVDLDVTSGTSRDRYLRIGDFLESFDNKRTAIKQGGYVRLPEGADMPKQPGLPRTNEISPPKLPTFGTKRVGPLSKAFRSTRSIIERQGASGEQLAGKLRGARDTQEVYQAQLLKSLPTVRSLRGKDFENFVDSTQGMAQPSSPKTAQAVQEWQAVHPSIRDRAVQAGLDVGDLGPNYYPHFVDYEKIFKDRNTYNESINHLVKTGQATTPEEAIKLLGHARDVSRNRRFGNLEASRLVDLPFYDKTPNSLIGYLNGSTKRIAQTEIFGAKDEKALDLIKNIGIEGGDTEAAKNAYDVAVGAKQYGQTATNVSNKLRQYQSTTRLGLGAITNASQSVNTGIVTGHLRTMRSMLKQLNPKTRAFVEDTGVIADAVINDIREQTGFTGKVLNKITAPGFGAVEKFNRSVAATAGRDYALRLAQKGDQTTLRKLGVKGEINGTLTTAQQIQAARRIVEKTQFKVDPQDLPGWASSPGGKLVAQFRTFSYNQSKFFSNEVLKPAARGNLLPLGRLLAALPTGYALYEVKRNIAGRPEESNQGRKGLEAFSNVGGAGLALDIFRGMVPLNGKNLTPDRAVSMAVGTIGGPTAGLGATAVGDVANSVQGRFTQTGRDLLRQIPIVGTAVQNRVLPYQEKDAQQKGSNGKDVSLSKDQLEQFRDLPEDQKQTFVDGIASKKEDRDARDQLESSGGGKLPSGKVYTKVGDKYRTFNSEKEASKAIDRERFDTSGKSSQLIDGTVYRRTQNGSITTTPKIQYDYQLNKATLAQKKKADDLQGWFKSANAQLTNIDKQLRDPSTDPLDALTLQNEAGALLEAAAKYKGYNGFTKPKIGKKSTKGKKKTGGAITTSFKTSSAIKAPSLPKIAVRRSASFKAPSIRKLSVSKIPTNSINKKRQTA